MGNISFGLLRHLARARRGTTSHAIRPKAITMEDFIRHFMRLRHGLWECTASAEYHGLNGRIQVTQGSRFARGTAFMGLDLARLLDEQYERTSGKR